MTILDGSRRQSLRVEGACYSYGGIKALDDFSLDCYEHSITTIVGPNGAGKSTLVEVVTGGLRPDSGHVYFNGKDISSQSRVEHAREGVIRTFQSSRSFGRLPVIENVAIAAPMQLGEKAWRAAICRRSWRGEEGKIRQQAMEILSWLGLEQSAMLAANELSGGQRILLEIGRCLMASPRLLVLDEPTAGVFPHFIPLIADRIQDLKNGGVTVVVVTHDLDFVSALGGSDVVVMASGKLLARGELEEVTALRIVREAYLGE